MYIDSEGKKSMFGTKAGKPKYQQLLEHLRFQIDAGELKPGDRLPSYGALSKEHGLTQATIDHAHKLLEKDGYIERLKRRGIFVTALEKHKNKAAGGLMDRSVLVFAGGTTQVWQGHQQTGWREFIPLGAINEIRTKSFNVMSLDSDNMQQSDIAYFLQHLPAGAVIIGEASLTASMLNTATRMQEAGIPVVVYGYEPELATFDRVISDHEQGCYELTKWLIEGGCQRILQTCPDAAPSHWFAMRQKGYLRAMSEAGLSPIETGFYPAFIPTCNDPALFKSAVRTMADCLTGYFSGNKPIEAIMAVTDGEVYVQAAACRALGKEPNKDVLFVGYDHYWEDVLERTLESTTPLATVDKRNPELGAALVQLLHDRIEGRIDEAPQIRLLTPRLVVHSSLNAEASTSRTISRTTS